MRLYAGPRETLILCGPGNNGGDGYVAARHLAARGYPVRVAALAEPTADAARWARGQWDGPVEPFADAEPAPIVIDCLFGTGLSRGLEAVCFRTAFCDLVEQALVAIACDLPSGVDSDDGALLSPIAAYDLTVTFGALKPAHRLMPAMAQHGPGRAGRHRHRGRRPTGSRSARPICRRSIPQGHKYSRGLVHCLAGKMPGAIALAATAAARAGAGYVRVSTSRAIDGLPVGDRPDRHARTSRTSGSAASWSARAWATCRRC